VPWLCTSLLWLLLLPRFSNFGCDWLASQARYARGSFSRSAKHASGDSPYHSSAKTPPLGGLPPPHGALQEQAAHLVEWSTTLSFKGSSGTCIPKGVTTFFHAAFTAHSDAGAKAGGCQVPGKGTGDPAPSPQTRTCAMNASGASVASSLRPWRTKQATPRLAPHVADPGPARCCGGFWVAAAAVADGGHPHTAASFCGPCGCACCANSATPARYARTPLRAACSCHVYHRSGRNPAVLHITSDTARGAEHGGCRDTLSNSLA